MSTVKYNWKKIKALPTFDDFLKREEAKDPGLRKRMKLCKKRLYLSHSIMVARKKAKLTQKELAQKAQTSQSFIAKVENGNQNITIDVLFRIADVLSEAQKKPVKFEIG